MINIRKKLQQHPLIHSMGNANIRCRELLLEKKDEMQEISPAYYN